MAPPPLRSVFPATSRPGLRERDDLCGFGPRGSGRDGTVGSDGDFDGASLVAVLDDVDLSPGGMDADPEALDIVIPDDALFLGRGECVDGSLCDFRHAKRNPSFFQ